MTGWLWESLGERAVQAESTELHVSVLAESVFERPRGDPISIHKHLKCENNKEEQEFLILVPNVLLAFSRRNRK